VDIGCALTQPAHSRFWENVVSQARYSRRGQVVRPKLDRRHIGHLCSIRKSLEAIQSTGRTNLRIYARERVLRARLADSAELADRLIRLLGMVERSGEPRSGRSFPHLQEALHEVRCLEPGDGSSLADGWRLGRSPSLFLCRLRSPTRRRTRLPYFGREGSRLALFAAPPCWQVSSAANRRLGRSGRTDS